ncbi:hypothetical protein C2S52_007579 [Perilla frutescens var. hirtella]|nr:hypothetical protein C2S52_007579 [Perilla frutescens var. hirtella]
MKTLTDIANMENMGDAALFDVMGTIVSHYRPFTREINGKPTKLIDLVLEDVDGNTITATLWENYAEEMIEFLETRPEAPVAVILQFCRPNVYRGDVRVSSLFNITKIVLDQKVSEIADFNFRYLTTGKVRSASITTLTSSSSRTIHEEIRDGDFEMKTISQIMTDGKIGNFWIYATILCVETIGDWSYLVCKRCQKKIKISGNQFFCEKCQSFDITGKLRYKLTVRVVDDSGTTTFLMWDKESITLIGKTATELSVGRSTEGIPPGLEKLANKKALFNVSVQDGQARNYTGSYSVARICTDREIIKKICGEDLPVEIGSSSFKSAVQSKSRVVIKKIIKQIMEDGEDEALEVLPADIERIANKKALFTIIVLSGQVNNYKGPYGVVKVASEDIVQSEGSEKQGTSSKSNKGKEKVHESADEDNSISDALLTPRKKNNITSNAVVLMDDDDVKRKLIDEFSATTQKRTKRLQKKEKQ